MDVPERYWRLPTSEAIDSLSTRFGLRNEPNMQDWEYQVADPSRLPEFLAALDATLRDDERFTLAEIVMQCFDTLAAGGADVGTSQDWQRFASLLRAHPALHAHTLCYWSAGPPAVGSFHVSTLVRPLWAELEPAILRVGSSSTGVSNADHTKGSG